MSLLSDYHARLEPWSDIQDCMERLYETACGYPQVSVLELGVRGGNSTSAFLAAAQKADGRLHSVDIAPPAAAVPAEWVTCGLWSFTLGDDMRVPLLAGPFDILFIDTSHAYQHTLDELRRYVPLVAPGGVVLMHDTRLEAPEGVGPQPPFPVARALDDFCAETGREWSELGAQYGLGQIARPNG